MGNTTKWLDNQNQQRWVQLPYQAQPPGIHLGEEVDVYEILHCRVPFHGDAKQVADGCKDPTSIATASGHQHRVHSDSLEVADSGLVPTL